MGLAASGARVVVNGRQPVAVDEAITLVKAVAPDVQVTGVTADLGGADGCASLVDAVPQCDILVNNVGIYGPQDFFETPDMSGSGFSESM
jgi:NAD(P)-dependent dehydrogenase (short-subunit alcohol dehydrogenase family)